MLSSSMMYGTFFFISSSVFPFVYNHLRRKFFTGGFRALSHVKKDELVEYWLPRDEENAFLKSVLGKESMEWVHKQNEECLKVLGNPEQTPLYNTIRSILDSKEKIPYVTKIQSFYYNFWQDEQNPRGLLRRTSLESYLTPTPNWEIVLDIDALGKAENESWVYQGYVKNDTPGGNADRVLLKLSKGGSDASVVREFDLSTKSFITGSQAFILPEAKSRVSWKSDNELIIGTNFGEGTNSLTDSGYPRVVKIWQRGTDFHDAAFIFAGEAADVAVSGYNSRHGAHSFLMVNRAKTFYTSDKYLAIGGDVSRLTALPIPEDAEESQFQDQILVSLRKSWTIGTRTFEKGSLLAIPVDKLFPSGEPLAATDFTVLFAPSPSTSLESYAVTKDYLLLSVLDDVKTRIVFWRYEDRHWVLADQESEAQIRGVSIAAVDKHSSNDYWITTYSFIQPNKLFLADASQGVAGLRSARLVKQLTSLFNRENTFRETQFKAISKDGTAVPYFMIHHKDMVLNSVNPTILYGYGGFEIAMTPTYQSVTGASWLERSFPHGHACYIVSNIRGGGEYGPAWHQAALRENRQKAYDDFIAVAEDVIRRRITSPAHLGIKGGSNGGLLVGNIMVQRPDLFAAVHCLVPLLDMKAYNKLLAGASWMAEYGNPDEPDDWAFLQKYSAYHQIDPKKVSGRQYPALIMTTSTRDDRVHPYHARAFVKRIQSSLPSATLLSTSSTSDDSKGKKIEKGEVIYYENTEGGHGGAADSKQQAFMTTLSINFFARTLGGLN